MENKNLTYHDEKEIEYTKRLRELLTELPHMPRITSGP